MNLRGSKEETVTTIGRRTNKDHTGTSRKVNQTPNGDIGKSLGAGESAPRSAREEKTKGKASGHEGIPIDHHQEGKKSLGFSGISESFVRKYSW